MKRLILTTLIVLSFVFSINAQWGTNHSRTADDAKLTLYFAGTLDTVTGTYDSLKSSIFSLEDYDQSGTYFSFNYVFTSAGTPAHCVDLYGTDNSGTNSYLIQQLVDTTASEVYTPLATNLSNYRFTQYFLVFENTASANGCTFKAWLHSPQKDPVKP